MSLILQVTKTGREQKANCRLNNLPLPRFSGFIIDSAGDQNADDPVIQVLYESQSSDVVAVKKIDDVAFGIDSAIPPTSPSGWVRGIGLKTEDGIVYAYARFAEQNGGMYKPAGVGIELKLILAEDGRAAVQFVYSSVDATELAKEVRKQVLAQVDWDAQADAAITKKLNERWGAIVTALIAVVAEGSGFNCANLVAMLSKITSYDPVAGTLTFACPDLTGAIVADPVSGTLSIADDIIPGVTITPSHPNLIVTAPDAATLDRIIVTPTHIEVI